MIELRHIESMLEVDTIMYKNMIIGSHIDYDFDGAVREFSVQANGVYKTFANPKDVYSYVLALDSDESRELVDSSFRVVREIVFTPGKPKTYVVSCPDNLSREQIQNYADILSNNIVRDETIHKIVVLPEAYFKLCVETRKEITFNLNGEVIEQFNQSS